MRTFWIAIVVALVSSIVLASLIICVNTRSPILNQQVRECHSLNSLQSVIKNYYAHQIKLLKKGVTK